MTRKHSDYTDIHYEYDCRNRLTEIIKPSETIRYEYNAEGFRDRKYTKDGITHFVYDNGSVSAEVLPDGMVYKYYRADGLIGSIDNTSDRMYYTLNSHGDVTNVYDVKGNILKDYCYSAYGKKQPITPLGINKPNIIEWYKETNQIHNPFGYCGEYQDLCNGLIYLRNRYYDPSIGRFITEDPVRDGLNWYVYCENNPINFVDPWGLYYISENKTTCYCMDTRCVFYGNPTGTYTVHKDNWFSALGRTFVGEFIPGGGVINLTIESAFGISGGNSKTKFNDASRGLFADVLSSKIKKQSIKSFVNFGNAIETSKAIIENSDIVKMDSIVFNLMSRNNISTKFSSRVAATETMESIYDFIVRDYVYFSNQIYASMTLYDLDVLFESKINADELIDVYADNIVYDLKRKIGLPTDYNSIKSQLKTLFSNYEQRLSLIDKEISALRR